MSYQATSQNEPVLHSVEGNGEAGIAHLPYSYSTHGVGSLWLMAALEGQVGGRAE